MAKLLRATQKVFGIAAAINKISRFGSFAAGSPAFSTDPADIQSLSQFTSGWFSAVLGGNAFAMEDMNAICYLYARQIAYLMQAGIAEWDAGTTYYIGSLAQDGTGKIYKSLQDTNLNHAVTDAAWWYLISSPMTTLGDIIYGTTAGEPVRLAGNIATLRKFLRQNGNGTVSAAPAWDTIVADDVPGRQIELWLSAGSTNTNFVRNYSTVFRNNGGSALTYTTNAVSGNGDYVTVNKAGVYGISMSENLVPAGGGTGGIALNPGLPASTFGAQTQTAKLAQYSPNPAGAAGPIDGSCCAVVRLAATDVIRGMLGHSGAGLGQLRITMISQD